MSKRIFTNEHKEELSRNPQVQRCSAKSITYTKDFKLLAVKQYNEQGMTAYEIFKNAGFNIEAIGRDTPGECLTRWNKRYRVRGVAGLEDSRGGAPGSGRVSTRDRSDADKIKRLEIQVAYLKAENDFLARLRAKRRE